eukprot:10208172-Alexandrium_andersonii.AAC.1
MSGRARAEAQRVKADCSRCLLHAPLVLSKRDAEHPAARAPAAVQRTDELSHDGLPRAGRGPLPNKDCLVEGPRLGWSSAGHAPRGRCEVWGAAFWPR